MSWLIWLALAFAGPNDEPLAVPEGDVESPRRLFDTSEYRAVDTMQAVHAIEQQEVQAELAERDQVIAQLQERLLEQAEAAKAEEAQGAAEAVKEPKPAERPPQPSPPVPAAPTVPAVPTVPVEVPRPMPSVGDRVDRRLLAAQAAKGELKSGPSPVIFSLPPGHSGAADDTRHVVPAGSYVKVRILTGVEASDRAAVPMTVQADYAAVGPNGTRVDLSGCMMVLKVEGDLSTDRVFGQATKLSCVRDDGEAIERPINGYLAGEDSTLGVRGQLISRQGRVLAAAAVAGLARGAGDAVAQAQTATQVIQAPLGGVPTTAQNITGNQPAYVGGTAVASASSQIADWYLDHASKLVPAIAVGSGRDVWVVLLDSVEVPNLRSP